MKVFKSSQIRDIDAYTIKNEPISSLALMERAANACAEWIMQHISAPTCLLVFTGPGNNGGDGWALARLLAAQGYDHVQLYHLQISHILSPDAAINRTKLMEQGKVPVGEIKSSEDFPVISAGAVVVDALFGTGLSRPLEGLPASLVSHINASGNKVISIDIPSGLMGENNEGHAGHAIIRATVTLTFQFPKMAFFYAENERYTGTWNVLPIGLHESIIGEMPAACHYITETDIPLTLRNRKKFSHKGTFGHALLISGSYGMMGAAILAARACMRSGAGLLTTHLPGAGYPIVQAAVPESIFSLDDSETIYTTNPNLERFAAIAAGPGIGTGVQTAEALRLLIMSWFKPLVLDADALNIMAAHPQLLAMLPENTILTPHPGEFDRLAGPSESGYERNQRQIEFSIKYHVITLLKGAHTSIAMPDGRCWFNSTGNPGMATAGSGDVLTGIILSLLSQGLSPEEAAITGTYIHGLSGDLAAKKSGQQALIASDIVNHIGYAFKTLERNETSPW